MATDMLRLVGFFIAYLWQRPSDFSSAALTAADYRGFPGSKIRWEGA
jgi:hypothetical protein